MAIPECENSQCSMKPISVVFSAAPDGSAMGYALVDDENSLYSLRIHSYDHQRSFTEAKRDAYLRALDRVGQISGVSTIRVSTNGLSSFRFEPSMISPSSYSVLKDVRIIVSKGQHPHTGLVESLSAHGTCMDIDSQVSKDPESAYLYVDGSYVTDRDSSAGGYMLIDSNEQVIDMAAFSLSPTPKVEEEALATAMVRVTQSTNITDITVWTDSVAVRNAMSGTSPPTEGVLSTAYECLRRCQSWTVKRLPREQNHVAHVLSQVGHRTPLSLRN